MEFDDKIKILNNFVGDIDCLEPLSEWTKDLNIFDILKLDRVEIRHSNMLAWLLDPNGTHGLNDKLLKKFLIYATSGTKIDIMSNLTPIDVDIMNLDDSVISREIDNIDILITSVKNKLVFAIENKIGTGEHSDQLNKYRQILQKEFGENFKYVLIYLSPEGSEPSDTENWVSMSYNFILNELDKIISIYKLPDKAKLYINDYIKAIRRSVVEDKELKDLCHNIYKKHKEAFDLLFENKPDEQGEISDYIDKYLKQNQQKFDITVWPNNLKNYINFIPNKLAEIYGDKGSLEWRNSPNLLSFEIQNFAGCNLDVKIIIGPAKAEFEEYRQKILDLAIQKKFKMKGQTLRNKWKTIKSNTLLTKKELETLDFNDLDDPIGIAIDNYMQNELPKIIDSLYIVESNE